MRLLRIFWLMLSCACLASPAFAQPYDITDARSPGGIRLIHLRIANDTFQTFDFAWTDGVAIASGTKQGLLTLAPNLLIRGGAGELDGGAFEEALKDLKGGISFNSGRTHTLGRASAPPSSLPEVLALLKTTMDTPRLPEKNLARLKRQILEGVAASREKADSIANDAMMTLLVGDHPVLPALVDSPLSSIQSVTREDVQQWRQSVFAREGIIVVAAGPYDRNAAELAADTAFAGLPASTAPVAVPPLVLRNPARLVVIERPLAQSYILAGGPTGWIDRNDNPARNLAMTILGSGFESRLFKAVREELGAAYGSGAYVSFLFPRTAYFAMNAAVDNSKVGPALAAMRREYEKFRLEGVTEKELAGQRTRALTGFRTAMSRSGSAASILINSVVAELRATVPNDFERKVAAVVPERLNATLREQLPEKLTIVVVTPSAEGLQADCVIKDIAEISRCL